MHNIEPLIESVDFVSFDIFDTAVLRRVLKPVDLFTLVAERFTLQTSVAYKNFKAQRIAAEKNCRRKVWRESRRTEVTLDEIYTELTSYFRYDRSHAERLKSIELDTEYAACIRNPTIYEIYRSCVERKKNILFISDIYLPYAFIETVLAKNDYCYHRLYVSSNLEKTKASGELYWHVLDDLSVDAGNILHIGDNESSDIVRARQYGLKTFFYRKCLDVALNDKVFSTLYKQCRSVSEQPESSLFLAAIVNSAFHARTETAQKDDGDAFWFRQGYNRIGILYLGFCIWLIDNVRKQTVEKIYFMARDGYIMQQVYEKLKALMPDDLPESSYLMASRRALNIPALDELDESALNFLTSGTSRLSVEEFLSRAGLDAKRFDAECRRAGFGGLSDIVIGARDYRNLRQLFKSLEREILALAEVEFHSLAVYFESEGFLEKKKIAVVDIGWHGSLQHSLSKLFEKMAVDIEMTGYYLGTFPESARVVEQGTRMSAYLCEQGQPENMHALIKESVEIFEFIHGAPHGSVIKIEQSGGLTRPVCEHDADNSNRNRKVSLLQQGALAFIDDFMPLWLLLNGRSLSRELVSLPIAHLLRDPTFEEAVRYGDLQHAEGYGNVHKSRYVARPERSIAQSIFEPSSLLKEYRQCFWRKGFIKRWLYGWIF
ncbi:MAG: HAD family hydrolase [Gammaproteobacteria bacterium]